MNDYLPENPFAKHPEIEAQLYAEICDASQSSAAAKEQFCKLKKWLCTPPQYTTIRVNTLKTTVEDARILLQAKLKDANFRDQPDPEVIIHPKIPDLLVVMPTQSRVTVLPAAKEVVVAPLCGEAVLRGSHVFIPGVLGAPKSMKAGDIVAVYADLDDACLKGYTRSYTGRKVFVGNGKALVSRSDLFVAKVSRGVAVQMTQPLFSCPPLHGLATDVLFLQNLPSALCSHILDPQPGEEVLDMCAAPGGKTIHIATLMRNEGLVVALDRAHNRVGRISLNCKTWGSSCVKVYTHDATNLESLQRSNDKIPQQFDKILVDAPCTGLGQRPRLFYRLSVKEFQSYPPQQKRLLESAMQLLKPGGTLVYSTCSISTAENEDVVAWALQKFPDIHLVKQRFHLGGFGRKGSGLTEEQRQLVQRFEAYDVPDGEDDYDMDTIGFFIACFYKEK
uniref:Putative trna and rrna cytosine-c5-methylase nucleolar protein nol1/nop2 n=2 Tax=Ornithodoros turicata TaxID=34597 RepID=A0A2R5L697_9ACAR